MVARHAHDAEQWDKAMGIADRKRAFSASPPAMSWRPTANPGPGRAARGAVAAVGGLQGLVDAMAPAIAVLDADGAVLLVNQSWIRTGYDGGRFDGCCRAGANYLAMCDDAGPDSADAAIVKDGLLAVHAGLSSGFRHIYWMTLARERRAQMLVAKHFTFGEARFLVIAHYDVGDFAARRRDAGLLSELTFLAQNAERRRIARDLHDSTAHSLLEIDFGLASLEQHAVATDQPLHASIREALDRVYHQVRTLSYLLHPPEIADRGLGDALATLARGVAVRTGIDIQVECRDPATKVGPEIELALYRVAQEALANVHKHSGAKTVRVRLRRHAEWLALQIMDDGIGFAVRGRAGIAHDCAGVGLSSMRERVEALGGRLGIRNRSRGLTISALVPLVSSKALKSFEAAIFDFGAVPASGSMESHTTA